MKTIAQQLNVTEFPFIIRDKNGNQIYFENSERYWEKWEHDSDGNVIYYETSTRSWIKKKYNSIGKAIYFENSDEYWYKKEYDSKGYVIYYEDCFGKYVDRRPKPCADKVVEIDGIKYKLTAV
jgi:hypothetical protein